MHLELATSITLAKKYILIKEKKMKDPQTYDMP